MAEEGRSPAALLARVIEESSYYDGLDNECLEGVMKDVLALPPAEQAQLAVLVFDAAAGLAERLTYTEDRRFWALVNYESLSPHAFALAQSGSRLLRRRLPLSAEQLTRMVAACVILEVVGHRADHIPALVRYLERDWSEFGAHKPLRSQLALLWKNACKLTNADDVRFAARIERMLEPPLTLPIEPGEAWTDAVIADLTAMTPGDYAHWQALLWHCSSAAAGAPSRKWTAAAQAALEPIGPDAFADRLITWLALIDRPRTAPAPHGDWRSDPVADQLILGHHGDVLKGLCWLAGTLADARIPRLLGQVAVSAYRKVAGIGPRAVSVGNAAVYALGQIPGRDSVAQLAVLGIRVKFGTAQKQIEKALDAAAAREGLPRDEIAEIAVPDYGLGEVGVLERPLGESVARLTIGGTAGASVVVLGWVGAKGKVSKSVPAAVKRDHAAELAELKGVKKDVEKMLPAQRDRIDGLFLARKSWAFATWRERYLDHPLMGTLARRLIWLFDDGRSERAGAWLADSADGPPHGPGRLVDADGRPLEFDAGATRVSLWHPVDAASTPQSPTVRSDVLVWRAFFEGRTIRQPFKQAHREVYLLTDAERQTETYSNRFAAHILRQHQFHALCGQRGWKNRLRLMVDAEFPPASRPLPQWDLRAEFWVEGLGEDFTADYVLDSGAFRFLSTDQVRFYRSGAVEHTAHGFGGPFATRGTGESQDQPLRLDEIPPLVLSEVLRDVDLFVGVASVGNNPEWVDGGPDGRFRDYWSSYSFGDLSVGAQSRRELLQRLVPRLAIASACTVTEKFLVVLGKLRTYKIHLGSGNILMEPSDQYLCIVPTSRMEAGPGGGKLFLPFEGDRTLAIILSKAFLLAEDDKITDRSIVQQILPRG